MSKRASAASVAAAAPAAAASASSTDLHPLRWQHARQRHVDWTKRDLLSVIYTLRQLLAVVLGLIWGLVPLTGLPAILLYLGLSFIILFAYVTQFLGVDDEDEKFGRWDLLVEGAWSGFATFLLTWICVYSLDK